MMCALYLVSYSICSGIMIFKNEVNKIKNRKLKCLLKILKITCFVLVLLSGVVGWYCSFLSLCDANCIHILSDRGYSFSDVFLESTYCGEPFIWKYTFYPILLSCNISMLDLRPLLGCGVCLFLLFMYLFCLDDCSHKTKNSNNKHKKADDWEIIWDEIYAFQKTLHINSLPKDEEQLANSGLYITIGKNGEKLYINKELSRKLFNYRCSK